MTANNVTFLRILLIPLIITLLLYNQNSWSFVLFLLAAATDGLDGFLARRLNQVTDFGKFLDPLADKLFVVLILIVMVWLGRVSALPVLIIMAREFAVSAIRLVKAKQGIALPASGLAKIKTVLQLAAVGMFIINIPFAGLVLWLAVLVSVISGIEYGQQQIKRS